MKTRALLGLVSAAVIGVCALGNATDARACGSAIGMERERTDNHLMFLSKAEKSIGDGNYTAAANFASQAFPGLKLFKPGTGPASDRALRVLALAVTRRDGNLHAAAFTAKNEGERMTNLEWAVGTLRALNAKKTNNPALQTDLGEALSKMEKYKVEAAKLLGGLADKDLLATAEGYAALAQLRSSDGVQRDAALKRCNAMAKSAAVCKVAPAVAS